jgi:hypothetical protein
MEFETGITYIVVQSYPNKNIPEENAPRLKYGKPASVGNSEFLFYGCCDHVKT